MLVEDGRIVEVDVTGAGPPPAAELVDLGDVTLMPGLVDAHVHLCFDASEDVIGPLLHDDDATLLDRMERNAAETLRAGITMVRDLGDRGYLGLALRERYASGALVGPEVVVSGPPITRSRGHCWFLGGEADEVEDLRAAVVERSARGCDLVKIMVTGGVTTPGSVAHQSQYGPFELDAVVAEARRLGLGVAAHAHGRPGIADSVAAGVDSVEHCTFLSAGGVEVDDAVLETLARQRTFVGATAAVVPGARQPPQILRSLEQVGRRVSRLQRAGVRLVCSSDAGVGPAKPHGVLPHGVVHLAHMGLTNADALASVTTVAAESCGLGDRKGRVAPGFDADLLAVEGNPLSDIEAILRVAAVFRAGVRVR